MRTLIRVLVEMLPIVCRTLQVSMKLSCSIHGIHLAHILLKITIIWCALIITIIVIYIVVVIKTKLTLLL